jgi:hypothetical protein
MFFVQGSINLSQASIANLSQASTVVNDAEYPDNPAPVCV